MNTRRTLKLATWLLWLALVVGLGTAIGQQTPPTENKGVTVKPLTGVDLGPEIDGMQGRQLRMRMVTVEPGGVVGVHSHTDRPGVVYVLQGRFIEHRGGVANQYGPGDTFSENKDTTHWVENQGTTPAVVIAVDIFKQP